MPTVKVPGLNPTSTVAADDLIHLRKADGDYRITRDNFKATLGMTGSEVALTAPSNIPSATNSQGLANHVGTIESKYIGKDVVAICKTVADMTAASITLVNGKTITAAEAATIADTGAIIETVWNNTTSKAGGARYEIKTLAQHRADIGNPSWVPVPGGDHYLFGGTTYVAVLVRGLKVPAECYGVSPGIDNTGLINTALANEDYVTINLTTCRVDNTIEVGSLKTLELGSNVLLQRESASSASTDPVIWLKGDRSSLIGSGQTTSRIKSQNQSPNGVILIGHESMTVSHGNVNWCTVRGLDIIGHQSQGVTSGSPTAALVIQNPEIDALTSYFHQIHELRVSDANYGIWLRGWANANTISNIQGYRLGAETALGGAMFFDNGSLDNAITNCFLHQSTNCVGVKLVQYDNTATPGGSLHQTYSTSYTGIVVEQGGASALGIKALDGSVNASYFHIMHNVSSGNQLDSTFLERNTFIGLSSNSKTTRNLLDKDNNSNNLGFSTNWTLTGLSENTQYKVLDVLVGNSNTGAIVILDYVVVMGNSIDWAGAGSVTYSIKKDPEGVVTASAIRYNHSAGGNFCQPSVSGSTVTIGYQVPNNGTATSSFGLYISVKLIAHQSTGPSTNHVLYDIPTTTTGLVQLTTPISL